MSDQEALELAIVIDRREQIIAGYQARLRKISSDPDQTDKDDILALALLHDAVIRWTAALDRRIGKGGFPK